MGKRIVFTGGSGKAGRHCIPYLLSKGHKVLNLDLSPLPNADGVGLHPDVHTLKCDLTDSGQVFNALSSHLHGDEYGIERDLSKQSPTTPIDAVIHFAAYASSMLVPDNETYVANITSTYNVIEAACKLGIRKIIIASSETTYGVCFTQGDSDYHSFPLEEDYDNDPMDSYALSKLSGEVVARGFARRFAADIYALRIGNVISPEQYESQFATYVTKPETRKRNAWSYIDARDLGQICHLAVEKDGLGFQVFNATNDTITTTVPTEEFLKKTCPNVPITRTLGKWEAPLSNKKIKEVLGFKEDHDWRKYVKLP
jgi:nucleoside-diphosphate-sugar epimerase